LNLSSPLSFLMTKPTSDAGFLSAEAERDLIVHAQAGDKGATEELLVAFAPLIRSEVKKFMRKHGTLTPEDAARVRKDTEHEVNICVLEAIRRFAASNGARLGTLAKTIIARRLPRQVYQRPPRSDALSRVKPGEDWRASGPTATLPRPMTYAQQAALIEIANVLRQVRKAALTPEEQTLIRVRYDDGDTVSEAAYRLGMSRVTFYTKHDAALRAMHDTLVGTGFSRADARVYLATLSRHQAPRTAPKLNPDDDGGSE